MGLSKEEKRFIKQMKGSYWSYRWLKVVVNVPKIDDNLNIVEGETEQEIYYELHEVYFDKKKKPFMWTDEPVKLYTDDVEDLLQFIPKIMDAANNKVVQLIDDKITELDEYMPKVELLEKYKNG